MFDVRLWTRQYTKHNNSKFANSKAAYNPLIRQSIMKQKIQQPSTINQLIEQAIEQSSSQLNNKQTLSFDGSTPKMCVPRTYPLPPDPRLPSLCYVFAVNRK